MGLYRGRTYNTNGTQNNQRKHKQKHNLKHLCLQIISIFQIYILLQLQLHIILRHPIVKCNLRIRIAILILTLHYITRPSNYPRATDTNILKTNPSQIPAQKRLNYLTNNLNLRFLIPIWCSRLWGSDLSSPIDSDAHSMMKSSTTTTWLIIYKSFTQINHKSVQFAK